MLEETLTEWLNGAERKGKREGKVEGMQQALLQLLRRRFGSLSSGTRRRVKAISSTKELSELLGRVLVAGSLAELGLGGGRRISLSGKR